MLLSTLHAHPRDARITFDEPSHTYTIDGESHTRYMSVTTWIHNFFAPFDADKVIANMMQGVKWKEGHKYWGLTPAQIKEQWNESGKAVSQLGTLMHANIEAYYNQLPLVSLVDQDAAVWSQFQEFAKDHADRLEPFRTEWRIFDRRVRIAGSVDMVFRDKQDGTFKIYDWKRTKPIEAAASFGRYSIHPMLSHIPDTNYWHYALQLNVYRILLERHYQLRITELVLVRLHPQLLRYELISLPDLRSEVMELFKERELELTSLEINLNTCNPTH